MIVDLRIQYAMEGRVHRGNLTSVSPDGCVIKGESRAEIGDVLFLSFEKGIPLGGFKGKVVGQTFQERHWTMGMYFRDLGKEEKEMLFERIAYFSCLQEKLRNRMEVQTVDEGRS